eukprot:353226-Chlamydomonas_euryale.AAC.7
MSGRRAQGDACGITLSAGDAQPAGTPPSRCCQGLHVSQDCPQGASRRVRASGNSAAACPGAAQRAALAPSAGALSRLFQRAACHPTSMHAGTNTHWRTLQNRAPAARLRAGLLTPPPRPGLVCSTRRRAELPAVNVSLRAMAMHVRFLSSFSTHTLDVRTSASFFSKRGLLPRRHRLLPPSDARPVG